MDQDHTTRYGLGDIGHPGSRTCWMEHRACIPRCQFKFALLKGTWGRLHLATATKGSPLPTHLFYDLLQLLQFRLFSPSDQSQPTIIRPFLTLASAAGNSSADQRQQNGRTRLSTGHSARTPTNTRRDPVPEYGQSRASPGSEPKSKLLPPARGRREAPPREPLSPPAIKGACFVWNISFFVDDR